NTLPDTTNLVTDLTGSQRPTRRRPPTDDPRVTGRPTRPRWRRPATLATPTCPPTPPEPEGVRRRKRSRAAASAGQQHPSTAPTDSTDRQHRPTAPRSSATQQRPPHSAA